MQTTKGRLKEFKRDSIFISIAVLFFGVVFVIFPESSALIICYALGAVLCVWGVLRILSYFTTKREEAFSSYGLVQGIALLVPGICILAKPTFLAGLLTGIFGVILIIDGTLKLQHAIDLKRIDAAQWKLVLFLGIITIVLGFIILFNPFAATVTLMIFAGISLIVDGVLDLFTMFYILVCVRQAKDFVQEVQDIPMENQQDDKKS